MNRAHLLVRYVLPAVACFATASSAQVSAANLTIDEQGRRAGLIFTAVVTGMEVPESSPSIAQITFRVTDGIRGISTDDTVTIHEWTGTWNGQPRYRVGEKILAFFYATGANTLTSPVGGPAGIFRFANDSTLRLTKAQQMGVARSARLRHSLGTPADGQPPKTVPAASFLRALRLIVDTP